MPELPELEVIARVLRSRILGQRITKILLLKASGTIIRNLTRTDFAEALERSRIDTITRNGKYLIVSLSQGNASSFFLVINLKLTGRLELADPGDRLLASTHVVLELEDGQELRYLDSKNMGQVYLTQNLALVPDFNRMGPDAIEITLEQFLERAGSFRGEIKGILTRGECIAGIGNAYADEILWQARIHPFRKRTQLTKDEMARLYEAIRETLNWAIDKVTLEMQEAIHTKPRDFMRVHMKSGEPCPRCGTTISVIQANQRVTNFCRTCQPGGLIRGM